MKKYILFGSIVGIGGWQIYIDAKVDYLKKNGWEVYVFCPKRTWMYEPIKINGLKQYEKNMMFELFYCPYHLSTAQQKKVTEAMMSMISAKRSEDEIVIVESTSIPSSFWGEILAKRLNAKHFLYLLHSYFDSMPMSYFEYFNFKYERKELAGMDANTLPSLFNGYRSINESDNYYLRAVSKNPICNSEEYDIIADKILVQSRGCDYIIGGFGTLNKPHTLGIYREVCNFANQHLNKKTAYIVIGSSITGEIEDKMRDMAKTISTLRLILVEEMFPVPMKLFKEMDVCIASWGSAKIAALAGAKTIRLSNDIDVVPQGLIGYTLREEPYSQYECAKDTLLEVLENVLLRKKYNNMKYFPPKPSPNYLEEHKRHMDFIEQSCQIKDYYSMGTIKPPSIRQYVKKYLIILLGLRNANLFFDFFRKNIY